MKGLMEEYGQVIVYCSVGIALMVMIGLLFTTQLNTIVPNISDDKHISANHAHEVYTKPTIKLNKEVKIDKGSLFDYISTPRVVAEDSYDGNITYKVKWYPIGEEINTNKQGVYDIRYVVTNSKGMKTEEKIKVIVE